MIKITEEIIREATFGESMEGVCVRCGNPQGPVEPDARNYRCEACGELAVYGIEQAVLEGLVEIGEPEAPGQNPVPSEVLNSQFGCRNCLWQCVECKNGSQYVPHTASTGAATCRSYAYYD